MLSPCDYQLLDFGNGRKLEQYGPLLIDRPATSADHHSLQHPQRWSQADLRFERQQEQQGRWSSPAGSHDIDKPWLMPHGELQFELRLTPVGQIGIFPEQARNWDWLQQVLPRASRPLSVLNLFAYTGGSTLAAAQAGAEVVHVDAAANVVKWARKNAALSNMADYPIRWITEDARLFVARELKRGNQYDAVILDPPSYGHGPRSQAWKIQHHLPALLQQCAELTNGRRAAVLVSCHTSSIAPAELEALVAESFIGHCQGGVESEPLAIQTDDGRSLPSGIACRWPARS
jgi:23S rRNA (cytosine1962-C5)-methyltransferase